MEGGEKRRIFRGFEIDGRLSLRCELEVMSLLAVDINEPSPAESTQINEA